MNVTAPSRAPGPRGLRLLNSLRHLAGDQILSATTQARERYGDVVRFWTGAREVFLVSHPELAQRVLSSDTQQFPKVHEGAKEPAGLGLVLGDGLLTSRDNESWFARRRMMQPEFHRSKLTAMVDKMVVAGEQMTDRWKHSPEYTFDLHEEMKSVSLDVVNRTMFGAGATEEAEEISSAVAEATRFVFTRFQNPLALPLWIPTRSNRRFQDALSTINRVVLSIIRTRRISREAGEDFRDDLLEMLFHAQDADTGEHMGDRELLDEAKTLFITGHETVASALTWTFYLLAQNPQVATKLHTELDETLNGRVPTGADLPKLSYARQVFEEALRMNPPVPLMRRRAAATTELGEYEIPAGSWVVVSIYNVHHHPGFWSDPELFRPERFSPERKSEQYRGTYAPFGLGQHKCIGNNFALMEGQLLLALISQRFEISIAPDHPVEREIAVTMRPKHGLYATALPRV